MNANVSKTNGVKLLAAVMVLAMVVAGAAVVLSDSEVNAADPVTTTDITTVTGYSEGAVTLTEGKTYYVPSNATITVDTAIEVDLYVKNGVTVILKGTNATSIDVFAVASYTAGSATQVDGLKLTASSSYADKTYTAGSNYITTDDTITPTTIGISAKIGQSTAYYAQGAVQEISLSNEGDVVTVTNGTATVTLGSNSVKVTATTGTTKITATNGIPTLSDATSATVTLVGGVIGSGSTALAASETLANYVDSVDAENNHYYSAQIITSVGTESVAIKTATVYGNVTQRTSVGSADDIANGIALTISSSTTAGEQANLTINNNVNVYVASLATGSDANKGTVSIFGALYVKTTTPLPTIGGVLGPNGYYEGIEFTGTNSNVTSGDNSYISGEFSGAPEGDFVIADDGKNLTIPEGTTFTVTDSLGLNGQVLIVKGTLVIDNRASVYGTGATGEGILIVGKGSIQNNGTIGKTMGVSIYYDKNNNGAIDAGTDPSIKMQGVSGVSFSTVKNGENTDFAVTGNVTTTSGAKANTLTINGAVITGDFTTAKKVTLVLGSNVTVAKNAAVSFNGNVSGSYDIIVSEGASVSVNGAIGGSIKAEVGKLGDSNNELETKGKYVIVTPDSNVTGFTMYVKKVAVADETDNSTDYYLRAYVNGSLVLVDKNASGTDNNDISIIGQAVAADASDLSLYAYIAAGETLNIGEKVNATITYMVFEGTAVFANNAAYNEAQITNYIGAKYGIDVTGENNEPLTTTYYTTLAAAMDKIADVNDEGVTAYVNDLDVNVTVANEQLLTLYVKGTISQDAVLTVENGATLEGEIAKVDGKMVIQPDVISSINPAKYDVMSTSEDGTVTYAGIAVAIAEAQPGDKITVETATIGSSTSKQSLTIPQGVEVTITTSIMIYGDLTIANEATLIGGTINMARADSKVTVNGTLDLSEGTFTGYANFVLTSNGTTVVQNIDPALIFNGAYYTGDDGVVITTVANAVKYAAENEITTPVKVHGKVTDTADLVLDGVDVTLDADAEVVLGNVTLTDATITSTGAKLTAVVTGINGEGDAAVNGTVSVNKSAVVIDAAQVVNAAGTTVYTYTINAVNGTMAVQAGTVVLKGTDVTISGESKFTVASGATLLVGKDTGLTVNGGDKTEFTVDGTLDVDAGTVTFTAGKSVSNGTVNISGNGTVNAAALVINGTVNISAVENDEGTFTVTNNGVTVGDAKEALGSTGSIVGIIGFDDTGKYIIAYAGTDMSGAKLANDAEFQTTAYYVNDALYATAYAEAAGVETPIDSTAVSELPGIDKAQAKNITWATADGTDITTNFDNVTIGQYDAVYAKAPLDQIKIKISVGTGISLYIDNVKIVSETYDLTIGTHTVSATVNPGYAGEVTISFNGQTVTGGSIEITVDSEGAVLSALGDISVDTGSTSGGDSGMGLTEILLIILVVLIVVMAIMVALRLMRS